MIMVRGNELACRNEWARDLWEAADSLSAPQPMVATEFERHPEKRQPEATPHEIAAVLSAQSTATAPPLAVSRTELDEDVVLSEPQVVTGSFATADWLLPGVEPAATEALGEGSRAPSADWRNGPSSPPSRPQVAASTGADLYGSAEASRGVERGGSKSLEPTTADRPETLASSQLTRTGRLSSPASEATGFHRRLEEAHHIRGRPDERHDSPIHGATGEEAIRARQQAEPPAVYPSDAESQHVDQTRPSASEPRSQPDQSMFGRESQSPERAPHHATREDARAPEPRNDRPMQRTVFREDPSPVPVAEAADLRGHFVGAGSDDAAPAGAAYDDAFTQPDLPQPAPVGTDQVVSSSVRLDVESLAGDEPLLPTAISVAPQLERICGTCRDFRPAEGGGRGWCANRWAFTHRRMVDSEEEMPCATILGGWWLPVDEIWLANADVSSHGHPTPLMDALFNVQRDDRVRRGGA